MIAGQIGRCLAVLGGLVLSLGPAMGCAHDPDPGFAYGPQIAQTPTHTDQPAQADADDDLLAWELRHAFADGDRFRQLELCAQLARRRAERGALPAGLDRLLGYCKTPSAVTATAQTSPKPTPLSQVHPPTMAWDFDGPADDRNHRPSERHFAHPGNAHYCQARLPDSADIELRRPQRSYGSPATLEMISHIARRHAVRSGGAPLLVGDICQQGGGPISGHRSHQTGYDADIGLPFKDPAGRVSQFAVATRDRLDLEALWQLLLDLSREGQLKRIFLDYEVQSWVYDWARRHGASSGQLERLLQYPYGERAARGLVRHWPKHRDHLHLRLTGPQRITHAI